MCALVSSLCGTCSTILLMAKVVLLKSAGLCAQKGTFNSSSKGLTPYEELKVWEQTSASIVCGNSMFLVKEGSCQALDRSFYCIVLLEEWPCR